LIQLDHYEARLGHAAELARHDAVEEDLRARLRALEAPRLAPVRQVVPGPEAAS
jgi:hypothetical protein